MTTKADPNANYIEAASANDKYNPFDPRTLDLDPTDKRVFNWILNNRISFLNDRGYTTSELGLELVVRNKESVITNEKGNRPPLVVVSSNRSEWIANGLAECDQILKGKPGFSGVMDLRALTRESGQLSPPIYCPKRVNDPKRNVYVVVHMQEYRTYRRALDQYGITVVGWKFRDPLKEEPDPVLAGFGASRFAAIEFCKVLHTESDAVKLAWLFDDNVVAMSKPFASLEASENTFKAGDCCMGFAALPAPKTRKEIRKWANNGGTVLEKPNLEEVGGFGPTFQQAVLWNIEYLKQEQINFGITYVASAEDVSFSRFITKQQFPSSFADSVVVMKEGALDNKEKPAEAVADARNKLERLFAHLESQAQKQGENPPPPVNVLELKGQPTPRTIANFIQNLVTKDRTDLNGRATCQAAEQITKTAIGLKFVDQEALDGTFKKVKANCNFRTCK